MSGTARYVRWQDGEMWLGHFEQFPDYLTQGESLSELEENLGICIGICAAAKSPVCAASPNSRWNEAA